MGLQHRDYEPKPSYDPDVGGVEHDYGHCDFCGVLSDDRCHNCAAFVCIQCMVCYDGHDYCPDCETDAIMQGEDLEDEGY